VDQCILKDQSVPTFHWLLWGQLFHSHLLLPAVLRLHRLPELPADPTRLDSLRFLIVPLDPQGLPVQSDQLNLYSLLDPWFQ
jgi:hypothetical protein